MQEGNTPEFESVDQTRRDVFCVSDCCFTKINAKCLLNALQRLVLQKNILSLACQHDVQFLSECLSFGALKKWLMIEHDMSPSRDKHWENIATISAVGLAELGDFCSNLRITPVHEAKKNTEHEPHIDP